MAAEISYTLHAAAHDNSDKLTRVTNHERRRLQSLSLPALLLIGIFLIIPVGWLFWLSFFSSGSPSLANYTRMLEYASYIEIFKTTFIISSIVTVLAIALGYPTAYLLAQLPPRVALLGLACVLLPFWTSILVRTFAWMVLLQRRGVINDLLVGSGLIERPLQLTNNMTGTVIGMLHIMLPFMIIPLYTAMKSIDGDYLRASMNLGASPTRTFFKIFVPLSLPGLIAGAVLVFVLCLGFYVTPELLGGGRVTMVSMKIEQNVASYFDWGAGSALGVVLLVLVGLLFFALHRLCGLNRAFGGQ